jgi:ribose 5-phosphate isomerase B
MNRLPHLHQNSVRLYLCRHGETHANAKRLIQGAGINSKLTAIGVHQADSLASAFQENVQLGRIVSSNLIRATQTARPLLSVMDNDEPTFVQQYTDLREMQYGDLEGLEITKNETTVRMRTLWQDWKSDLNVPCPGKNGESMMDLIDRAENILWQIAFDSKTLRSRNVAVVSHSMLLRAVLTKFLIDKEEGEMSSSASKCKSIDFMNVMNKLQLANCSITVVDFDVSKDRQTIPPNVLLINCTDHVQHETGAPLKKSIDINDHLSSVKSNRVSTTVDTATKINTSNSTDATNTSNATARRVGQLTSHLSNNSSSSRKEYTIVLGSDHGGYDLKIQIQNYIREKYDRDGKGNINIVDVGCYSSNRCDYPDVASLAGHKVVADQSNHTKGIVFCGSGIGISIAANKVPGIRCALLHDHYGAFMCRKHNNANMIALGGRTTGIEIAKDIVDTFLTTEFEGCDRHERRVEKIHSIKRIRTNAEH